MVSKFCGTMGRSMLEFNELSPYELSIIIQGYDDREQQKYQQEWERVRWLACMSIIPHAKQGKRIKPTDLVKFPWEVEDAKAPSKEKIKAMLDRINKRDKTNHKITISE